MKRTLFASLLFLISSVLVFVMHNASSRADSIDVNQYDRPSSVYDKTIYRTGDTVSVYDLVNGDLYCFGSRIIVDAVINGDVLCVGNTITIKGSISNDIRVVGDAVVLDADIGGNISIVASDLQISSTASIAGDATIIARRATIDGNIARDATIRANTVIINGSIDRNLTSYHNTMTLGSTATVGDIKYSSPNPLETLPGATTGNVTQFAKNAPSYMSSIVTGTVFFAALLYIAWFISLILTALGVAFLFPKSLDDSVVYAQKEPWITALAGVITVIAAPIIIGLLIVSLVGIPLATIVGFLFGATVLLSAPFVAHLLGALLFPTRSHPVRALAGAVLLLLLFVIPFIQVIAFLITIVFGTGLVIRVATERYNTATVSYKRSPTGKS